MQALSGNRVGHTVIQGGYMVCSSCGVDLANKSHFCRYCGRAQSVASTSVRAAQLSQSRARPVGFWGLCSCFCAAA